MQSRKNYLGALSAALLLAGSLWGQEQPATQSKADAALAAVVQSGAAETLPPLIKFSGTINSAGAPQVSQTESRSTPDQNTAPEAVTVTFSLYEQREGGSPLWAESQSVQLDKQGRYTVFLGATQPEGLPLDLFIKRQAHWLGVQPTLPGASEQPRVLLVGVPYALKAADADTLGGKPVSAFVTTDAPTSSSSTSNATGASASPARHDAATGLTGQSPASIGGAGTKNAVPLWTSGTTLGNSLLFQAGGNIGLGTTTPMHKFQVDFGNMLVRGPNDFKKAGDTAFLFVGDTNHAIEALWNGGLSIGAYKVPRAFFIAGSTGNVGIGTTTPTNGILSIVAKSKSAVGLDALGWNATSGSNLSGGDAIHATGGNGDGDNGSQMGGAGVVGTGGKTIFIGGTGVFGLGGGVLDPAEFGTGGIGVEAVGGSGYGGGPGLKATGGGGAADCCGPPGVIAQGGPPDGNGIEAHGYSGTQFDSSAGVIASGGDSELSPRGGPGILANGGVGSCCGYIGGDGIDAIAGADPYPGGTPGLAGSFTGDVAISGNLTVAGTKSFRIDHPLDPANKYLYHAAVESSEVLDFYTGNVVLDENGEATVQFPDWFEALNRDFRYQLTAVGAAAPNLHIAQTIQDHKLRITGGSAGLQVSWQVTAVRQDLWERVHPMVVEVVKPARERGYYSNPELFGAPAERGLDWARYPQLMQRVREARAKAAAEAKTLRPRR